MSVTRIGSPQPHGSKHQAEVKKLSERVRPEAGGAHSKSLTEMVNCGKCFIEFRDFEDLEDVDMKIVPILNRHSWIFCVNLACCKRVEEQEEGIQETMHSLKNSGFSLNISMAVRNLKKSFQFPAKNGSSSPS